jgi:HEAT repeat protein
MSSPRLSRRAFFGHAAAGLLLGATGFVHAETPLLYRGRSVDAWIQLLASKNDQERGEAAYALAQFGPASLPALPLLLGTLQSDSSMSVRLEAAGALGALGPAGAPAVPALLTALTREKAVGVRGAAANALGGIGPVSSDVIPALVEALRGDDAPYVRGYAVTALGAIGPAAAQLGATAVMAAARHDASESVRRQAQAAQQRMGLTP